MRSSVLSKGQESFPLDRADSTRIDSVAAASDVADDVTPKPDGLYQEWYSDGHLKCSGEYKDGKQQGHWEYFSRLGEKESEGFYVNGQADGRWFMWYPGGRLCSDAYVRAAQLDGYCQFWQEDGSLDKTLTGTYSMGKREEH
jgi:antitoxin component YwqK of YwqJK toxin-antitoxin module